MHTKGGMRKHSRFESFLSMALTIIMTFSQPGVVKLAAEEVVPEAAAVETAELYEEAAYDGYVPAEVTVPSEIEVPGEVAAPPEAEVAPPAETDVPAEAAVEPVLIAPEGTPEEAGTDFETGEVLPEQVEENLPVDEGEYIIP